MLETDHPLVRAARICGGREVLASHLKVTPAAIGNWKSRGVPIEHCPEIERLTGRVVTRQQLRPDDWRRIWPELADLDDHGGVVHVVSVGGVTDPVYHHEGAAQ